MRIKTDFLLSTALALFATDSHALEWLLQPDFSFKERYDDNVRLQVNPKNTNFVSTLSPGLTLGYLADNNELKTNFKWNEIIYDKDSSLDFSEKLAGVSHQFLGERFRTDLSANYAEESSLNTQLDASGSGDTQALVPRTTQSVAPSVTYNLSEKNAIQLGYSYADVSFQRSPNLVNSMRYSDYTNEQYSATATHIYNERLSFNLSGSYSVFDSTSNIPGGYTIYQGRIRSLTNAYIQNSNTLNYQAGLQYAFSEKMQLTLSAGMRNTETQTDILTKINGTNVTHNNSLTPNSTSGHVFSAGLTRKDEWGDFNLTAGQQLNPASSGSQQQSTSFGFRGRYNIAERWATGISGSYLLAESISIYNNNTVNNNRTYASISPNLLWRWTPEINIDLSYTLRQQKYESIDQTATGNSVQLQFSYQPQINRQVK